MPSNIKELDPRIVALVRADQDLRKAMDPKVTYAMSPEMMTKARFERNQMAQELGLSQDEALRIRQISGYKGFLKRINYPVWRINSGHNGDIALSEVSFGVKVSQTENGNDRKIAPGEVVEVRELISPRA